MLMYWIYILQSESSSRYYCGSTNNVERRVSQHNDPAYHGTKTTKRFPGPWKLIWSETFPSRAQAMEQEKKIKKRGFYLLSGC
ncbi:MAG: excinuclease ABC subunit C [Candidatus Hydrogenedentota bacterium]|nr:MAG: excinuclease ABC subunit C [Candidatus Hydrogenedentota bacterium]PCJ64678.1 MAG: excinuclease ABC subunit C [Candidatus Hydrogenedentota bacterium]